MLVIIPLSPWGSLDIELAAYEELRFSGALLIICTFNMQLVWAEATPSTRT